MKFKYISILLVFSLLFCGCSKEDTTESEQQCFAMDTYMTVKAYGAKSEEATNAAVEEINRLDNLWSVGNEDSEIAIANKDGSVELSGDSADLISLALELNEETDGALDITVYPLMDAWGFTTGDYTVPSQSKINKLLKKVNIDNVIYDSETKMLTLKNGTQIDLGAIAKGYTSNRIMEIFKDYDIKYGMVSLGGNVQTLGTKPDGDDWTIGIENPNPDLKKLKDADYLGTLKIHDQAVITSGDYERYFEQDGKKYFHILDPKTGYPAENGLISVTIISDDGALADGLSTSLFVMGKDKALAYWKEHQDEFDTILVESDGSITITNGIKDTFDSSLQYDIYK